MAKSVRTHCVLHISVCVCSFLINLLLCSYLFSLLYGHTYLGQRVISPDDKEKAYAAGEEREKGLVCVCVEVHT